MTIATTIYGDDDDVRFRSHSFFPIPPRSIVGSIVAILIETHLLQAISLQITLVAGTTETVHGFL